MFLFFVLCHLTLSRNFYGSGIRHGIFGGFDGSPRDFSFLFDFVPHSIIPVT